jgi:hypothetical protein
MSLSPASWPAAEVDGEVLHVELLTSGLCTPQSRAGVAFGRPLGSDEIRTGPPTQC